MSEASHTASIDPREVRFYTGLADTWWDRTGPFWPLHRLNELRVAWIRERLCRHFRRDADAPRPLAGLRVLDVGCGGGILSESIARLGADVHGIDVVTRNVHIARLHAERQGLPIRYEEVTAEQLAVTAQPYDVVLNMEVVEHVADVAGFMQACTDLVRAGGAMFVATINRTPLAWLFAIVGAEYVLRWLPRGTHRWPMFVRPEEVRARLAQGQMGVRDSAGVRINPFTRRFSLQRSLAVNFMQFAVKAGEVAPDDGAAEPA